GGLAYDRRYVSLGSHTSTVGTPLVAAPLMDQRGVVATLRDNLQQTDRTHRGSRNVFFLDGSVSVHMQPQEPPLHVSDRRRRNDAQTHQIVLASILLTL